MTPHPRPRGATPTRVHGRVVSGDTQAACAGAIVEFVGSAGTPLASALTDDTGRYSLELSRGERTVARVTLPGWGTFTTRVAVDDDDDELDTGVWELRPAAGVEAFVLGPSGQPLAAGVEVVALRVARDPRTVATMRMRPLRPPVGLHRISARTNEDGVALFPSIGIGSWRLTARDDDVPWRAQLALEVSRPDKPVRAMLRAVAGRRVTGEIASDFDAGTRELVLVCAEVSPDPILLPHVTRAVVSPDGTFSTTVFADGPYFYSLTDPNGEPSFWRSTRLRGGDRRLTLAWSAENAEHDTARSGTVSGQVLDSSGTVLPGCLVHALWDVGEGGGLRAATATTDPSGVFTFHDLPVGRYRLQPDIRSYGSTFSRSRSSDGAWASTGDLDVTLRVDTGLTITGRLLDEEQRPVRNAILRATRVADAIVKDRAPSRGQAVDHGSSTTDRHGRFCIAYLREGSYRLRLASDGFGPRRRIDDACVHAAGSRDLLIVGSSGASIGGVIEGVPAGDVASVEVWAVPHDRSEEQVRGRVRDDGSFEITGLRSGAAYEVAARTEACRSETARVVAGDRRVVLSLSDAAQTTGYLVGRDGAASAGALRLVRKSDRAEIEVRADTSGYFSVPRLALGRYDVFVELGPGDEREPVWLGVVDAGSRDVQLRIPAAPPQGGAPRDPHEGE